MFQSWRNKMTLTIAFAILAVAGLALAAAGI
jgi:hypothetical protein